MAEIETTLKQLKEELVSLGMPQEQVDSFNTKGQVLAVINTLKATAVVKKVDTLEEKTTPAENKQLERQWRGKAERMKARLMSQPMVSFYIPINPGEKIGKIEWRTDKNGEKYQFVVGGSYETVQLNGFKWFIAKGMRTNVPEQVADILDKSYRMSADAGANISMDRIDEKTGRPINEVL